MPRPRRRTQTRELHRRAIARTQPPCGICGDPIDYTLRWPHPDAYVADHIVPLALGGADSLDNKQAAHNRCNSDKRAKPHADIIKRSGTLARPNTGHDPRTPDDDTTTTAHPRGEAPAPRIPGTSGA